MKQDQATPRAASVPSVAARMDRLPITPLHVKATIVIGLGLFFDIYEIFLSGTLSTVLKGKFGLGGTGLTWLLASSFLGMFLGAVTIGRIADRLGRRRAFLLSLGIYSVFTVLAALSPNVAFLVICRFIAGFGIGAEPPVSDAYLGDLLPPKKRGFFTSIAYTVSFVGVPVVGFLGHWLVPLQPLGVEGWRWLFLFGALGALIIFVLRTGLPESPRWLASAGRDAEAEAIVERFERAAQERGLELSPPSPETPATTGGSDASELFKAPYARRTWMMIVFQFLQTWGYYGFGTLVPSVLAARGFDIVTSLGFLSVIFIGYPAGSLISLPIIERIERKQLVCGGAIAMAVFGIAFGLSGSEAAILVLGFCYTAASNVFSNAYHVYQAEIFPTRLRATAASGTYSLSRLSSGLMPFILLPLLEHHGSGLLFTVVAAAMVVVAVNVLVFGPRATGRTLTDVNLVQGDRTVAPGSVAKEAIG